MSLKEGKRSSGETDGGLRVTEGHLCRGRHLASGFCVGVIGTTDFHSVLEIECHVVDRICPGDACCVCQALKDSEDGSGEEVTGREG